MRPTLFVDIAELVQPKPDEAPGDTSPIEVTKDAALLVRDGRVVDAGPRHAVQERAPGLAQVISLGGRAVVPGLVDSHTHIVFAGDRIDDFARRARGDTYESIARAGGGIARSAALLADASLDELVDDASRRLGRMLARGTTTCEVKTGYGLLPEQEAKQLSAIRALPAHTPVDIVPTLLAHIVPRSWEHGRDAYVRAFTEELLAKAAAHGDVRFCDVFVESTAFTPDEARRIAARARALGVLLKLHVDQLHDGGGAALAAELCATSADHLEHSNAAGRQALAQAGVVATVLPGCRLFLGKGPWPEARALRDSGCEVAIATDCNPGSSMVHDLALCATLAVTQCGLSVEEALWGATRGGAKALGLRDRGCLRQGERADFVVLGDPDWRSLLYYPGEAPIHAVYIAGKATA